jgi:hypothetical protein
MVPEVLNEAPTDEANADKESKSPAAEAEADLLFTDDQDGELDPTEVLGADIEKDDT